MRKKTCFVGDRSISTRPIRIGGILKASRLTVNGPSSRFSESTM